MYDRHIRLLNGVTGEPTGHVPGSKALPHQHFP